MPPLETYDRYTPAVYWPKTGENRAGEPVIGEAVQLMVRWNWTRREMRMPDNSTVMIEAEVVTDRKLLDGSILWQGVEDDLPPGTNWADEVNDLYEVVGPGEETNDLKARRANTFRAYFLSRYGGALPQEASE